MVADFLIHNTSEVFTCAGVAPRIGARQADAGRLARAVIASFRGVIVFTGNEQDWTERGSLTDDAVVVDAAGRAVVPGFVDPHTHAAFTGDRAEELAQRLAGASYADIAAAGGGIVRTVLATRSATEDELATATTRRLDEMLRCGTTTCEVKSGYGLTTEAELKCLRVLHTLAVNHPIDVVTTFMGAHEIPPEFRGNRAGYLELLIEEMIPAVARQGFAEWCDVFCEHGVFTPEESEQILASARRSGMKLRIHADELGSSGGARVAAGVGARSADHLIFVSEDDGRGLASAGVVATLLPIAAFYLKLARFAPARMLINGGVAVALATDVNPGGGFSPSMPFAIALACFCMNMTFEEALVAATINAAFAVDRHGRVGSLEPGKEMDAVIVNGPAIDLIRVGARTIHAVVKKGRIVHAG